MFFKRDFKQERRRQRRQLLNTSVQVFTGSIHVEGVGINVSAVGMCLFTVTNLPVGIRLEVEFFPPESCEPVRVSAAVRHRALYLYGIEFLQPLDQNASGWMDRGQSSRQEAVRSEHAEQLALGTS
jgi:hypothetical protein